MLKDKKKCETCGKTYKPTRSDQRYHSEKCRKRADRKRANRESPSVKASPVHGQTILAGYVAALMTAREAARKRPSDTAEKELNRLVALLVDEMKSLGITRRQKQSEMRSGDIPTVGQLISAYDATIENMSPTALKAHRLRERLALEMYAVRLGALGCKPDFGNDGGMASEQAFDVSSIEPILKNIPGPIQKQVRELVGAGFEFVGFDRDQLSLLVQLAIEEVTHEELIAAAIGGAANSFRLKSVKMRCKRLEHALALDSESVTQSQTWTSPEEALVRMYVEEMERPRDEEAEAEDASALLSSTANLYELGVLEGPPPPEVQAEMNRRNSEKGGDVPTLRDVTRQADTPF